MARFYSNENFPIQVVRQLREFGHEVLTSFEAGRANQKIPDLEVLQFAVSVRSILLTLNRRDFLKIHNSGLIPHLGIILCTADPDFLAQAQRVHKSMIEPPEGLANSIIRVNRNAR